VIGNFSTIEAGDIDTDGDDDLFLGARNVPRQLWIASAFLFIGK
jgi:hypothetical protein